MTDMHYGETNIKVPDYKVAEMERKGWKVTQDEPVKEIQIKEDLNDGDSYGF